MIFFWLFGDAIKMIFLLVQAQPLQFILSNAVLLVMETTLIILFFSFNKKSKPSPDLHGENQPSNTTPLYQEALMPEEQNGPVIRVA
jgi:hypothetical protein